MPQMVKLSRDKKPCCAFFICLPAKWAIEGTWDGSHNL